MNTPQPPGFRLHQVEVYNWGTFHQKVWQLNLGGENALLTGDIGSGKSTLVDAITTLLMPAHRVAYNKAAGADIRERNLRSYVLGHYKAERGQGGPSARPVALRDQRHYSVLLGLFRDACLDQTVTVAQVFWCREAEGTPTRLFVVADGALTIREHFSGFGADFTALRKRLRARAGCEIHDTFPPYGAAVRRMIGASEQALDLFHQTVSMKAVGNLTDFVRQHMLEPSQSDERIAALLAHFADLTSAHQKVQGARRQIDTLVPLMAQCSQHAAVTTNRAEMTANRDALRSWFAEQKRQLLEERIARLTEDERRLRGRLDTHATRRDEQERELGQLIAAIATNGGDRIAGLERELGLRRSELESRRQAANRMSEHCALLTHAVPQDPEAFLHLRSAVEVKQTEIGSRRSDLTNQHNERFVLWRRDQEQHRERATELSSLRNRRSNIEARLVQIRTTICTALDIPEDELPFAGELIQVRAEERVWEGAIERVLRSLGQSLLIPEDRYAVVTAWVDSNDLRGRLVYFHVRQEPAARRSSVGPRSLVRKIEVKSTAWCQDWLDRRLTNDFDYACCDAIEDFRREHKALTRNGQVKGGNGRHEKDDRQRIDDRTRFVLGWSNADKIAALEAEQRELEGEIADHVAKLAEWDGEQRSLTKQADAARDILAIQRYADVDTKGTSAEILRLEEEIAQFRAASDILARLTQQKKDCEKARTEAQQLWETARGELASAENRRSDTEKALSQAIEDREALPEARRALVFPCLEALRNEVPAKRQLTVESAGNCETDWREWLQARIDALGKQLDRLRDAITQAMADFRTAWPHLTREVDAGVEAAAGYQEILDRLQRDDLLRFEAAFRRALKENTIREIANFQAQLQREQHDIVERITAINRSLADIDYNRGRYIALMNDQTSDVEVADFRRDLRACTENTLGTGDDNAYSEAKYQQVAAIIDRLRGRTGQTDPDRRWREKVTDVRNWFAFSASERWRADHTEHEHYADSGGKSGGQKEKLAYTVLAASLAYQYGLGDTERPRHFRFVVIDEAFGRGSDESARFGLELFAKLQLQLLIATPLQKIHVIEPYVANVGFVSNRDGSDSMIRNLTIDEYRAETAARGGS